MKKAKVGDKCKIKIQDASESGYELSEDNVKIKTENILAEKGPVKSKSSGFLATVIPKEPGILEVKAVFEVLDETKSSSIEIKVKEPEGGVDYRINPHTMPYPGGKFTIEFFPGKDEEAVPDIDLEYLKAGSENLTINQISKRKWKASFSDSACGVYEIEGECKVWNREYPIKSSIEVVPSLDINPDPSTGEVPIFAHWKNRLNIVANPTDSKINVSGDYVEFDQENCEITLSPSELGKRKFSVRADKNGASAQKEIEYKPEPLVECPDRVTVPPAECELIVRLPKGDPEDLSIELNGEQLESTPVINRKGEKVIQKEIGRSLKIGENEVRITSDLLSEPVTKAVHLEHEEGPIPPIDIKFKDYGYRAHLPVKVDVRADPREISEFITNVDGERKQSCDSFDGSFDEFDLGSLEPGDHAIKVYDSSDPSTSEKREFKVYPYLKCEVIDEFYNISEGESPEIEVALDEHSKVEDFMEPKENPEVYNQSMDALFIGEEKHRLPLKTTTKTDDAEPGKNKYIVSYSWPETGPPETGLYRIQWDEMEIREDEKEIVLHSGIEIDSEQKAFYGDLDSSIVDLDLPDIPEIRERFNLEIRLKSPEVRHLGEHDVTEANLMDLIKDQGPGNYEVILQSREKIHDRTEFDILDVFLFPTVVSAGGKSYVQVAGPEETEPPEIEGIEKDQLYESPYLTVQTLLPSESGSRKIEVDIADKTKELRLKVMEGKEENTCLNRVSQILDQNKSGSRGTSIIVVSPLGKLYFSPLRQWIGELLRRYPDISVGTLYWKVPERRDKVPNIEEALLANRARGLAPLLVEEKKDREVIRDPRIYDCPVCDRPLRAIVREDQIIFECENNHRTDRIHFTLEEVLENPPDVLFMARDFFENITFGADSQYEVYNLTEKPKGCPECGRINPKITQASKLGGVDELRSVLKEVRRDLDAEIQNYNDLKELDKKRKRLWKQWRKISEKKKEKNREKKSLNERLPILFKSISAYAKKLNLKISHLREIKRRENRLYKEKQNVEKNIEELYKSQRQKSIFETILERIMSLLGNESEQKKKIRKYEGKGKELEKEIKSVENQLSSLKNKIKILIGDMEKNKEDINNCIRRRKRITDEISSLRNSVKIIPNKVSKVEEKLSEKGIEDFDKFEREFWKEVSERIEKEYQKMESDEADENLSSPQMSYSTPLENFVENVRENDSNLIDSELKLDIQARCPKCDLEWEPIQNNPALILHQPKFENLPEYLQCEDIDSESIKNFLAQKNSDVDVITCRY